MFEEYIDRILDAEKEAIKNVEGLGKEIAAIKSQPGVKLIKGVNNIQLSRNFNLREFVCKGGKSCCNGTVMIDPELIRRLQAMRDELDLPINIASGFRCPDYNKRVGGVKNSYHMRGQAADIKSSVSAEKLYTLAQKYFADGGIGRYDTFVHVDTGPQRRWNG